MFFYSKCVRSISSFISKALNIRLNSTTSIVCNRKNGSNI